MKCRRRRQQLTTGLASLRKARSVVENAFGILASPWWIYNHRIEGDPATVDKIIKATVCHHNYLKKSETCNGP
uniref:DDE Tnp4 domain-containing protein n=1 Tax=Romanomermis culicivorax TaxID=13658 RepID=A0A915IH84_ROMCU